MPRVHRQDFAGPIRSVSKTPQGGLRVPAAVTRTGVLRYQDHEGRAWREYRPPEEVFAADSLATLRAAPVTDLHPPGKVTAETWETLAKGHVDSAPTREGGLVVVDLAVQAAPLVGLVETGDRRDTSCGYECDVDWTPGVTPEGEAYDAVQREIRYNHVALLPPGQGRAGTDVALRMDGAAFEVSAGSPAAKGNPMKKKLKIGGREFRVDADEDVEAAQGAVDEVIEKKDEEAEGIASELKATKEALMQALTTVAKLEAKLAAAEATKAPAPEITEEMVPEAVQDSIVARRGTLLAGARGILGPETKLDGLSAHEIRSRAVAKAHPALRLDGLSADTVQGMFAILCDRAQARTDAVDKLGHVLAPSAEQAAAAARADGAEQAPDHSKTLQSRIVAQGGQPIHGGKAG